MKITDLSVRRFRYISNTVRDSEGHGHPGPEHEAVQSVLTIHTDEGVEGYFFGSPPQELIDSLVKPYITGEDPFYRERIWHNLKERQRLNMATMSDRLLNAVDLALWDLAGRALNIPVHKLLGATRDKVPAYASTMCGDDIDEGVAPGVAGGECGGCKIGQNRCSSRNPTGGGVGIQPVRGIGADHDSLGSGGGQDRSGKDRVFHVGFGRRPALIWADLGLTSQNAGRSGFAVNAVFLPELVTLLTRIRSKQRSFGLEYRLKSRTPGLAAARATRNRGLRGDRGVRLRRADAFRR